MNSNIGIITFHRAVNYGAVFQAYALKVALLNMGVNAEIIDYRCDAIERPYIPKIHWDVSKQCIMDLLCYYKKKKKYASFCECVEKKLSPIAFDEKTNSRIHAFITGSDQVWNYNITGRDANYFLSFAPKNSKKISYAACSDKYTPDSMDISEISIYLKQFDSISVRDKETAKFVKNFSDKDSTITVDPTFLLDVTDWDSFAITTKHKCYVLVFAVGYSERMVDFAYDLAKQTGRQVVFINSGLRKKGNGVFLDTIRPDEAVGYFMNADYIVTNSFHGTAMSLIFEKEFFVELEHDKKGRNNRVEDMLSRFGVKGREICSDKYMADAFEPLDYSMISENIKEQREASIQWLTRALS